MLSEMSFAIWEMSFHILAEMSFGQNGQKKSLKKMSKNGDLGAKFAEKRQFLD